jgi:hypothetical protein
VIHWSQWSPRARRLGVWLSVAALLLGAVTAFVLEMFPVIEINTGHEIHFILVRGVALKLM